MEIDQSQLDELKERQQAEQQLQQLERTVKARMSKEAIARFGTVKVAHPQIAVQSLIVIAQAIQKGTITSVDDALFKSILQRLTPQKHTTMIKRI